MHVQFVWPTLSATPQSCMANCILFEKENNFHMAFVLGIGQMTQVSAHKVHLKYDI